MHRYLKQVHAEIVKPCVLKLKGLMQTFNFASEAEIFSSDLRFKMFDNSSDNRYRSNMPNKNEDSMARLKSKLGKITDKFSAKFVELTEQHEKGLNVKKIADPDAKTNLAVAVYLATYLDCNQTTKEYLEQRNDDDDILKDFLFDVVLVDLVDEKYNQKMKNNFDAYKTHCKKIVNGDSAKQMKMLSIRKFLSVPWLVCPDALLGNFPSGF